MDNCPVCGYLDPENPPVDSAICACCGTQFGYHDARHSHEELRRRWISHGYPWSHPGIPPPHSWSPSKQLAESGFSDQVKIPVRQRRRAQTAQ